MKLKRWLIGAGIVVGLCVLVVIAIPSLRSVAVTGVDYVRRVGPTDLRVCLCRPDAESSITTPRGLPLPVSIYGSAEGEARGAVVLVHGNTPAGRTLPLYRVLAQKLSDHGFAVVVPDLGGFGDSGNPFALEENRGYRFAADLRAVAAFVRDEMLGPSNRKPSRLMLIGHSMGATPALRVGLTEPGVRGVVAIGPPRRVRERMASAEDRSYFWNRAKRTHSEVYGSGYPAWFTREDWLPVKMREALETVSPLLKEEGHDPVLFLDGGLVSDEDLKYLERFVAGLTPPVAHHTVSGSNHYVNVGNFEDLMLYDAGAVGETVDMILRWFDAELISRLADYE